MEILINHLAEKPIHHLIYLVCIIWTAITVHLSGIPRKYNALIVSGHSMAILIPTFSYIHVTNLFHVNAELEFIIIMVIFGLMNFGYALRQFKMMKSKK